jgi:hypothetical protein
MSYHFIIVKNISLGSIQGILMDMANMYRSTPYVDGIELYSEQEREESYLITFPQQPDLDRFTYFVNYIVYPIDRKWSSPLVTGYFDTALVPKSAPHLKGKKVMVYVSEDESAADAVYLVTEANDTYKFDFGGKVSKLSANERDFEAPSTDISNYSHYIDIHPGPEPNTREGKPWWKLW